MAFQTLPGSNMCAFEVSVGFASAPGSSTVSWTDVTPYVRTLQTRRGRTRELDSFQTGTMTVVLNNSDRRFDPTYVSTPYGTTNLIPMVPFRFRAQYNAVTYDVFYGYATGWPQSYPDKSNHYAESVVTCVDGFEVLAATTLPSSLYELVVGADRPDHWWKLDDVVGATTAQDTGYAASLLPGVYTAGFDSVLGSSSPTVGTTGLTAYDNDRTCVSFGHGGNRVAVNGQVINSYPFSIEAWINCASAPTEGRFIFDQGPLTLGQPKIWFALAYDGQATGGTLATGDRLILYVFDGGASARCVQSNVSVATGAATHVSAVANDSSNYTLYVNGVASTTVLTAVGSPAVNASTPCALGSNVDDGSGTTFGVDGRVQHVATYSVALTAAQVLAHYQAGATGLPETTDRRVGRVLDYCGWSSTARSLDTGSTTVMAHSPSGTGLDYSNTLAQTENGGFYVDQSGRMKWRARQSLITVSRYTTSTATFSDAAGGLAYTDFTSLYDRTEVFNDVRTTRSGGATQVAQSTSSITSYLRRTLDRSGLFMSNDNEALAASQYLLYKKQQPQYQVRKITVKPQSDPANLWPQVLARELEDEVTVVRTPVNLGSAITQTVRMQSIAHRIQPDMWETDYELSPTTPDQNWWIWGTSTWSGSTSVNPAVWGY